MKMSKPKNMTPPALAAWNEKERERQRIYYETHKEQLKEYKKEYRKTHKEQIKEYNETHKEQIKEQIKEYRETHKEQRKEYYETHKEQLKEYRTEYYETHKEQIKEQMKEYYETHKEQIKEQMKEYYETRGRDRLGIKPMSENKECALYLGVHVAERVLSKVFKDVEVMPMNNPGYDFICNRGKKIDVKSSCTSLDKRSKNIRKSWNFCINKNKIPDFFLCLAFDNRNDLTPLNIWLIPSEKINDKVGITITETKIEKWDQYKFGIESVVECCEKIKIK